MEPTGYYLLDNPNPHRTASGKDVRWRLRKRDEVDLLVVHTAECEPDQIGDDDGAERVARYFATTKRSVSIHVCIDSDSVVRCLPDNYVAWHAGRYNERSWGAEPATYAALWPSTWSEYYASPRPDGARIGYFERLLEAMAEEYGRVAAKYQVPVRRINKKQADAGERGIVAHGDLDPKRRTDPGPNFPWELFIRLTRAAANRYEAERPGASIAEVAATMAEAKREALTEPAGRARPVVDTRDIPRGVFNHNPGNLRIGGKYKWEVLDGTLGLGSPEADGDGFARFTSKQAGMAACLRNLEYYITEWGLDTVEAIINKWAPASDGNDPDSYVEFVSRRTKILPNVRIEVNQVNLPKLAEAIAVYEVGHKHAYLYPMEDWEQVAHKYNIGWTKGLPVAEVSPREQAIAEGRPPPLSADELVLVREILAWYQRGES